MGNENSLVDLPIIFDNFLINSGVEISSPSDTKKVFPVALGWSMQ